METNSHLFLLIWPLILITISQKLRFNIFNFFNFFDTKLRFHVFCYDLIWSAHMHVCIFYILSASSIIWLWNYFPSFPCYFSKVPYYNSGFRTIVCHSIRPNITRAFWLLRLQEPKCSRFKIPPGFPWGFLSTVHSWYTGQLHTGHSRYTGHFCFYTGCPVYRENCNCNCPVNQEFPVNNRSRVRCTWDFSVPHPSSRWETLEPVGRGLEL